MDEDGLDFLLALADEADKPKAQLPMGRPASGALSQPGIPPRPLEAARAFSATGSSSRPPPLPTSTQQHASGPQSQFPNRPPPLASLSHQQASGPQHQYPGSSSIRQLGSINSSSSRPPASLASGYIEAHSKLRVSQPLVSSVVVKDRLEVFTKLSSIQNSSATPTPGWATVVILGSKVQAEGKNGSFYSRWQVTDFETTVTLFLWQDAHKELYKESERSVLILNSPKV